MLGQPKYLCSSCWSFQYTTRAGSEVWTQWLLDWEYWIKRNSYTTIFQNLKFRYQWDIWRWQNGSMHSSGSCGTIKNCVQRFCGYFWYESILRMRKLKRLYILVGQLNCNIVASAPLKQLNLESIHISVEKSMEQNIDGNNFDLLQLLQLLPSTMRNISIWNIFLQLIQ